MSRKTVELEKTNLTELSVPAFGYELIREDLIDEILGDDAPGILYWAGKQVARKYPLFSIEEMREFFLNAGWGELSIQYEKKKEIVFTLTSEIVKQRISTRTNPTFQLEAGFLAEQITQQKKVYAETFEHPKKKEGIVTFTVKWDDIPFTK